MFKNTIILLNLEILSKNKFTFFIYFEGVVFTVNKLAQISNRLYTFLIQ